MGIDSIAGEGKDSGAYDRHPEPKENQYILSDSEQNDLDNAGLGVNHVVPQAAFEDDEHFRQCSNNFCCFFWHNPNSGLPPQDMTTVFYQSRAVFKRFCIIRPRLAEQLLGTDMRFDTPERPPIALYHEAYRVMTALVDAGDEAVTRRMPDGAEVLDHWLLCR